VLLPGSRSLLFPLLQCHGRLVAGVVVTLLSPLSADLSQPNLELVPVLLKIVPSITTNPVSNFVTNIACILEVDLHALVSI
jgi:hypothetical protein